MAKPKQSEAPAAEANPKGGGSFIRHPETGELNRVEGTAGADESAAATAAADTATQPE